MMKKDMIIIGLTVLNKEPFSLLPHFPIVFALPESDALLKATGQTQRFLSRTER